MRYTNRISLYDTHPLSPDQQTQAIPKLILIVEDEKPLSHALSLKLAHEGYQVTVADDGEKALQEALQKPYDLILLDIIMPKLDGFAVLAQLQQKGSKAKVMVLSNLGLQDDINRAKALGATDYLVKSNTPISQIVQKIKGTLV